MPEIVNGNSANEICQTAYFRERQFFSAWAYALCVAAFLGVLAVLLVDVVVALLTALIFLAGANVLCLRTRVTGEHLHIRFGVFVPFYWRSIRLADIDECRVITYRPIRDAGGWGIRFGRFEGQPATFYSARGARGVRLDIRGKRPCIVGSQSPELLRDGVQAARPGAMAE